MYSPVYNIGAQVTLAARPLPLPLWFGACEAEEDPRPAKDHPCAAGNNPGDTGSSEAAAVPKAKRNNLVQRQLSRAEWSVGRANAQE